MKSFYSWLDNGSLAVVPQRLQHLSNNDMAARLDGKVSFYSAEDSEFLDKYFTLGEWLAESPRVDGIVFFSLKQFTYSGRFDFSLLKSILARGYEVHFSRENLSLASLEALTTVFPTLYVYGFMYGSGDPTIGQRSPVLCT